MSLNKENVQLPFGLVADLYVRYWVSLNLSKIVSKSGVHKTTSCKTAKREIGLCYDAGGDSTYSSVEGEVIFENEHGFDIAHPVHYNWRSYKHSNNVTFGYNKEIYKKRPSVV